MGTNFYRLGIFFFSLAILMYGASFNSKLTKANNHISDEISSFIPLVMNNGSRPTPTDPYPTIGPQPTSTPFPSPTSTPPPLPEGLIYVDHNSVSLFEYIPDHYIQNASQIWMLFRHASVGNNIYNGLNCLRTLPPRPNFCDRGTPPELIVYDTKYNRDKWTFEFHLPPPYQNPGWWEKVNLFIERVDQLEPDSQYQAYGFKFGYVDGVPGSVIDDVFFNPTHPFPSIEDLEELEQRHPNKLFIYWTMGLARISNEDTESFNQQMREYAVQNNKILLDIADIQSHLPDGTKCYDREGRPFEALCDEYTEEINGGHLNGYGMLQMSKAIWVLMAKIAGWDG
jgi:hypothetical protein